MISAKFPLTGEEAVRAERKISLASSSIERPWWAARTLNRVLVFSSSCRIVIVAMLSMLSLLATNAKRRGLAVEHRDYFRDQQGLELDFLVPRPHAGLWLIESKASKTVRAAMAAPLLSLQRSLSKRRARLMVVHRKPHLSLSSAAIAPGVEAVEVGQFAQELNGSQ
jgi:hypothetical protein